MQAPVVRYGDHSSHIHYGFTQANHLHDEDAEGSQHFSRTHHTIVIMPQSPRPNLSVRTNEPASMPRPCREDASLSSHPQGLSRLGHQTLSHFEMARLEKDRRDWRELAAFLRTNDPPKSNYMSNTDDEDVGGKSKKHAASLKMFRRSAAKKSPSYSAKPLQLPDSAVAARTTKGHWHIAISIPLSAISTFADDVHQATSQNLRVIDEDQRAPSAASQPPSYRPASAQNTRSGTATPTRSQSSIHPALRKEQSMPLMSSNKGRNDGLSGDAADIMKNYYRQERLINEEPLPGPLSLDEVLSSTKRKSHTSSKFPSKTSPLIKCGTFGAAYDNDIDRNNSQRTDPRHSGETTSSDKAPETIGHSRGISTESTKSQMPPSMELPKRTSSRRSASTQDSGKDTSSPVKKAGSNARRMEGHKMSGSDASASSLAMIEATEGLQHQLAAMRNMPRTPAPTRALPDLPEVSDDGCACVNHRHGRSISDGGRQQPLGPSPKKVLQERQEKVKALRMRDIAAQKAKARRRSTQPPSTASMVCAPGCQHAKTTHEAIQPLRVRTNSLRTPGQAAGPTINTKSQAGNSTITLSPIRTIASISPTGALRSQMYACTTPTSTSNSLPDDFLDSLLPSYDYHRLSSAQRHTSSGMANSAGMNNVTMAGDGRSGRSGRSSGARTIRTLTPPRSLEPSLASSDEDGVVHLPRSLWRQSSNVPGTQSERSKKRNSKYRYGGEGRGEVGEIKERMGKLERDNERILKTLEALVGMHRGVRELCELLAPSAGALAAAQKERTMTEGEKAARRVSRTLEPAPVSLRTSPRESQRGDDDMAQRMRDLEKDMERLGSRKGGVDGLMSGAGWEELSAVEPLMREVRMSARISMESGREGTDIDVEEEDEEELGYALLGQVC